MRILIGAALLPYFSFSPSQLRKLAGPQQGLADGEELVKLRWWNAGTREHRMRLAAVMDLMLEEMQQQAVGAFGLYVILTMDPNGAIRSALVERIAGRNSASVGHGMGSAQAAGPSVPPSSAST
jgi:hypothetical protein